MVEFSDEDMRGARFTRVDLGGARFERVDLTGAGLREVDLVDADLREVDLTRARIRGAILAGVDISGDLTSLTVNGVEVSHYVQAELDRRDPDRARMRPTDPDGFRLAWDIIERRWAATVERARGLDPELLYVSVDGEWSFIDTLRHLVFATDSWIRRAILGDPAPWHPLGLPWEGASDWATFTRDRTARPSLDVMLALRRDRMDTVRQVVDGLTEESLAGHTAAIDAPGWPPPESFPTSKCLLIILDEEWEHNRYAERDLDAVARPSGGGTVPG